MICSSILLSMRILSMTLITVQVAQEMRDRLHRWMVSTGDPLLRGPVAAPPGAVANDPNGISPKEPPIAARTVVISANER